MNGNIRPRTTQTAACSGSTATPATGTNDTRPNAAAASSVTTKADAPTTQRGEEDAHHGETLAPDEGTARRGPRRRMRDASTTTISCVRR